MTPQPPATPSGIPAREAARLDDLRRSGTFTSGLSVPHFAALRGVGLDPVGQVVGASVFRLGYLTYNCSSHYGTGGRRWQVVSVATYAAALREARDTALWRLVREAQQLGADGVVDVQVTDHAGAGVGNIPNYQNRLRHVRVMGTAVRARGNHRPARPFTCDLNGSEVAQLMRSGWMPAQLAWGVGVAARHDETWPHGRRFYATTRELVGRTELVTGVRALARQDLAHQLWGTGSDAVVLRETHLRTWTQATQRQTGAMRNQRANSTNHVDMFGIATLLGTGLVPFDPPQHPHPAIAIMPLR